MEDLTKDFADKIYELHKNCMERAHTLTIANLVLALVTLGLVVGVIAVKPEVSAGGLSVTSSADYLLLAVTALLAATYTYIMGLTIHAYHLMATASACYEELGLRSTPKTPHNLLKYPEVGTALTVRPLAGGGRRPTAFGLLAVSGLLIVLYLVPFGAMIAATYQLFLAKIHTLAKLCLVVLDVVMVLAGIGATRHFARSVMDIMAQSRVRAANTSGEADG